MKQLSFNLTWTDLESGNRVYMENMGSKYLANIIIKLGAKCIDPEIEICPNQEYLGDPK